MRADFFLKLETHRLPVSIKEWLTWIETVGKGVIGPSVDEFCSLSRTTLKSPTIAAGSFVDLDARFRPAFPRDPAWLPA